MLRRAAPILALLLLLGGVPARCEEPAPAAIAAEALSPEVIAEARALLSEGWRQASDLPVAQQARIARLLGLAQLLTGDMSLAEDWLRLALELDPEDRASAKRLELVRTGRSWESRHEQ